MNSARLLREMGEVDSAFVDTAGNDIGVNPVL